MPESASIYLGVLAYKITENLNVPHVLVSLSYYEKFKFGEIILPYTHVDRWRVYWDQLRTLISRREITSAIELRSKLTGCIIYLLMILPLHMPEYQQRWHEHFVNGIAVDVPTIYLDIEEKDLIIDVKDDSDGFDSFGSYIVNYYININWIAVYEYVSEHLSECITAAKELLKIPKVHCVFTTLEDCIMVVRTNAEQLQHDLSNRVITVGQIDLEDEENIHEFQYTRNIQYQIHRLGDWGIRIPPSQEIPIGNIADLPSIDLENERSYIDLAGKYRILSMTTQGGAKLVSILSQIRLKTPLPK